MSTVAGWYAISTCDCRYATRHVTTFVNWIAAECKRLSQKHNKLAIHEAFRLKSAGLSRGALDRTSSQTSYVV